MAPFSVSAALTSVENPWHAPGCCDRRESGSPGAEGAWGLEGGLSVVLASVWGLRDGIKLLLVAVVQRIGAWKRGSCVHQCAIEANGIGHRMPGRERE